MRRIGGFGCIIQHEELCYKDFTQSVQEVAYLTLWKSNIVSYKVRIEYLM